MVPLSVAPVVPTGAAVTLLPCPNATLTPAMPAAMLAPRPITTLLVAPLSLAPLPTTTEPTPFALVEKPSATALVPVAAAD